MVQNDLPDRNSPPEGTTPKEAQTVSSSQNATYNSYKTRLMNWIRDAATFSAIALPIMFIFEHLAGAEGVRELRHIQHYFNESVSAFSPWSILKYIFDGVDFISAIVGYILYNTLKLAFSAPTAAWIVGGSFKVLIILYLAFALGFLPIFILLSLITEGNVLAGIFAIVCWLITTLMFSEIQTNEETVVAGVFLQVLSMVALMWIIKLSMLAANVLFGWVVDVAEICVGGSIIGAGAYWCVVKKTEHSLTDRLLHYFRFRRNMYK